MADVDRSSLRQHYDPGYGKGPLQYRDRHLLNLRPQLREDEGRLLEGLPDLRVDLIEEVLPGYSNPQPVHALVQPQSVVLPGPVDGPRVAGVVTRDGVHYQGRVPYRPGHRSDGVETPAQGIDPVPADAAEGRLQSDDPAQRGRDAHRAAGVASERRHDLAGGYRRSRPSTGPAGDPVRVPRVVSGAVVRIDAGRADGELVHLQLAHHDRARPVEPLCHGGIRVRDEVAQYLRPNRGAYALGVIQVLEAHGDPVERAQV